MEAQGARDGRVRGSEGGGAEHGRELVQVVPDFVDGLVRRAGEVVGGGVEGSGFKEEANFVGAGEEVVITDVRGRRGEFAGGEFR